MGSSYQRERCRGCTSRHHQDDSRWPMMILLAFLHRAWKGINSNPTPIMSCSLFGCFAGPGTLLIQSRPNCIAFGIVNRSNHWTWARKYIIPTGFVLNQRCCWLFKVGRGPGCSLVLSVWCFEGITGILRFAMFEDTCCSCVYVFSLPALLRHRLFVGVVWLVKLTG
jgi:hypothetical protein